LKKAGNSHEKRYSPSFRSDVKPKSKRASVMFTDSVDSQSQPSIIYDNQSRMSDQSQKSSEYTSLQQRSSTMAAKISKYNNNKKFFINF
jgi:hypothetical protein